MDNGQLRITTMGNILWRFAERCGAQGVTFVVSIILARLLEPEAYGTIALLTIFVNILQVFIDSGFGNALIQKKESDQLDFSTVFHFNMVMCIFVYAILFFCAPFIAKFYSNEELVLYIRVLGITLLVSGIRNIQQAYVSKNMMFRCFFYSSLGGTTVAAVVGIGMAYAGCGIWALIGQNLTNVIVNTVILFYTVKWKPTLEFSFKRFRSLFTYGWKLLVSSLLDAGYNELRQLLIGKIYSSSELAYYNQGNKFPHLIVSNINASIDSVLLPSMSKSQNDVGRIKAMTRRAMRTSTYIMAPLMIGLAACSENIVSLLLTEKWLHCVPYLRIFCVTYMFYPIHTANLNAIKAMGRSDWFLKLEIVKKTVGLAILLITIPYGVLVMAYSQLITTLLSTMINAYPNRKLLGYSWFEQMKDILPNIVLAVVMAVPVYMLQYIPLPSILVLVIQVIGGAVIYIGVSIVFKVEMFYYILDMIKPFYSKIFRKK